MKITLSEIWNFIDLIDTGERGWSYSLHAANVTIEAIAQKTLEELKSDPTYDTELLPSIFTFREILWQPDVFTEAQQSLPGLRILKAFCEEWVEDNRESSLDVYKIYCELVLGLAKHCDTAIASIEKSEETQTVTHALGELRIHCFPIIKFFIFHPQNRIDYYRDAVNRLNYAVKIMLTQFFGRYTELEDPYWKVRYSKKGTSSKKTTKKETQT